MFELSLWALTLKPKIIVNLRHTQLVLCFHNPSPVKWAPFNGLMVISEPSGGQTALANVIADIMRLIYFRVFLNKIL